MRLLLDTHVVLWWGTGSAQLPADVRPELDDPENEIAFSAISAAEIAIKVSLGKLVVPAHLVGENPDPSFVPLPFTAAHAIALRSLPLHHRDPFDRMLVAQALAEGLVLVSVDDKVRQYDVPVFPPRRPRG